MKKMVNKVMSAGIVAGAVFIAQLASAQAIDPHQPNNYGTLADSETTPPGAVAPGLDPGTAKQNAKEAALIKGRKAAAQAVKAQYAKDLAAFDAKVAARGEAIKKSDATYASRRVAYADAMSAWRKQVSACKAGHDSACRAPTPQPSNY